MNCLKSLKTFLKCIIIALSEINPMIFTQQSHEKQKTSGPNIPLVQKTNGMISTYSHHEERYKDHYVN